MYQYRDINENELKIMSSRPREVQLFYKYIKRIYDRYKEGRSPLWMDFPYDLYRDIDSWIDRTNMKSIKEYINIIKENHPYTKESGRLFWSHWLCYKSTWKEKLNNENIKIL